jgi:hypothetical protein
MIIYFAKLFFPMLLLQLVLAATDATLKSKYAGIKLEKVISNGAPLVIIK